ncbi:K+/H+ antiporter subunit F [Paracoccus sp. 11-3]|uniref:K+/H+ antiporter subunit F n=1 Tax=Paracoccus amoyensis TaxID=2760093 RepID=A0A926GAD4_9RHOB|nr:K+/H+ antiporter subunit F [Paracoccus amoyensis]MBC9247383.1 K+/H+ antiporter subunit F [Paracoccus amoyensis]
MSGMILTFALGYAQLVIAIAACLAGSRILLGPRAQDRVLALDTLYLTVMLLFLITGMRLGSVFLFEAAMVIAVMGFVATVALTKFLFRGEVIE